MSVSHSEIKAALDAGKSVKKRKKSGRLRGGLTPTARQTTGLKGFWRCFCRILGLTSQFGVSDPVVSELRQGRRPRSYQSASLRWNGLRPKYPSNQFSARPMARAKSIERIVFRNVHLRGSL
jgi:hypothetical protein